MLSQAVALCRGLHKNQAWKLVSVSVAGALAVAFFARTAIADGSNNNNGGSRCSDGKTWAGSGWGLGIAADFDLGGKRVTGAELDTVPGGNIVRLTDTSGSVGVSFVLEAHYFLKDVTFNFGAPGPGLCKQQKVVDLNCTEFANDPFVAVEIGGGTAATTNAGPITGYALGWMIGLHHPSTSATFKLEFRDWAPRRSVGYGFG